jgi:hypothetical protein
MPHVVSVAELTNVPAQINHAHKHTHLSLLTVATSPAPRCVFERLLQCASLLSIAHLQRNTHRTRSCAMPPHSSPAQRRRLVSAVQTRRRTRSVKDCPRWLGQRCAQRAQCHCAPSISVIAPAPPSSHDTTPSSRYLGEKPNAHRSSARCSSPCVTRPSASASASRICACAHELCAQARTHDGSHLRQRKGRCGARRQPVAARRRAVARRRAHAADATRCAIRTRSHTRSVISTRTSAA